MSRVIRPNQLCIARVSSGNYLCTTINTSMQCAFIFGGRKSWLIKLLQPARGLESLILGVTVTTPFNVGEDVCCEDRCLFPVDELDLDLEVSGDTVVQKEDKQPQGTPQKIPETVS